MQFILLNELALNLSCYCVHFTYYIYSIRENTARRVLETVTTMPNEF